MKYRLVFLILATLLAACRSEETVAPPALVLVVVDTARADHFGVDGYPRDTTPNFDRLALEGSWYSNAWSQAPWTLPAIASILTGLPPEVHGAGMDSERIYPLNPGIPTLAEYLKSRRFQTGAVMNVVFCDPSSGLDRGFESYDFATSDASNRGHRDAAATTDAALGWAAQVADRPFFLLVHYFDAHLTYDPPSPFDDMFLDPGLPRIPAGFGSAEQVLALRDGSLPMNAGQREALVARYDGELRYLDREFGRLRAGLERLGRWDDSLVVVAGDHGEEFWDHGGFEHGHSHFRELLRVPLIIRKPGQAPSGTRSERIRLTDILPTVLTQFGMPVPQDLPGRIIGSGGSASSTATGSLWAGDLVSVRTDDGTLIRHRESGQQWLFAPDDPDERHDLSRDRPDLLERLEPLLPVRRNRPRDGPAWIPGEEERERLRSLGYVR